MSSQNFFDSSSSDSDEMQPPSLASDEIIIVSDETDVCIPVVIFLTFYV